MTRRSSWGPWGMAALALTMATGTAQSRPPSVAGVFLGMSEAQARGAVGSADRETESLGMRFWDYQRRGVTLIWKEGETGVQGIVVSRGAAGDVGGVKVGDSAVVLRKQWGTPARVRQEGRFLDFIGAGWVLSAEMKEGTIVEITLMAAGAVNAERK